MKTLNDDLLAFSELGNLQMVKMIIENSASIHTNNDYALSNAAYHGHLNIVKYLVENGADIHAVGDYVLRHAARNGHLDVVKYLEGLRKQQ